MLVLGIDPGTAITGYGLVREDEEGLALVNCGVITTPSDQPLPARLQTIYQGLTKVIREQELDAAAVEELFFSRNVRTALSVGHARGVTTLALADANLPIFEYKPLEIKQAVEHYFGVKVLRVHTQNVRGKVKRLGRFSGKRADWKKAIVTLSHEDSIDLFDMV